MKTLGGLLLVGACVGPAVAAAPLPPNAADDVRLATRISLRAEGIPVSRVLARLSDHTGVALRADGVVGDERLVAFVPDAPLTEVMARIAEHYRLEWSRGSGERPAYRLYKPPARAREERVLREKAVREVLERLAQRLKDPRPPLGEKPNEWAPLFRTFVPLIDARGGELLRENFAYFPIGALPADPQRRIAAQMQPVLDAQHAKFQAFAQAFRAQRQPGGEFDIRLGGEGEPPPDARECTVTAEIMLRNGPQATVGLQSPQGTWWPWVTVEGSGLEAEGLRLYAGRRPIQPERAAGEGVRSVTTGADLFDRAVEVPRSPGTRKGDWIGALGRLSEASGLAIYADCYPNYLEGIGRHPREAFEGIEKTTPREALDALCYPLPRRGAQPLHASSFWWRNGNTAQIRSRRWLWESAAILPAWLSEQLAASLRRSDRLESGDLRALAGLTMLQAQSAGFLERSMESWQRAVRVSAHLSPAARNAVLNRGVRWDQLSPEDRATARRLLPAHTDPARYHARLGTTIHDFPGQGGAVVSVEVEAGLPGEHAIVHLPLPGVDPLPGLKPRGLDITSPVKQR